MANRSSYLPGLSIRTKSLTCMTAAHCLSQPLAKAYQSRDLEELCGDRKAGGLGIACSCAGVWSRRWGGGTRGLHQGPTHLHMLRPPARTLLYPKGWHLLVSQQAGCDYYRDDAGNQKTQLPRQLPDLQREFLVHFVMWLSACYENHRQEELDRSLKFIMHFFIFVFTIPGAELTGMCCEYWDIKKAYRLASLLGCSF